MTLADANLQPAALVYAAWENGTPEEVRSAPQPGWYVRPDVPRATSATAAHISRYAATCARTNMGGSSSLLHRSASDEDAAAARDGTQLVPSAVQYAHSYCTSRRRSDRDCCCCSCWGRE